ncbi:Alkyldihydroxyacetonephosphate synthase [[Actinomadura] parvosata subsp. kistnae]|uniref:FAD-binding oxidoreductase n=1 Tax=[Actinomadura] parvosata subsp. kistnae TaxID=1909395 RepID=A0A1U9ZQX8_9ACTN|nr:FAD-binding oxidoreductase [Nonomuraea sp. ATCC 55076]AQZ60352.1 FAD-binding oxidoreductase [Nonomuraea sp. ATCC 55076]SPL91135.1 Alkyldihydroxyacetonephosphate synthase [Actinomadura parvosata subsp. kistnae]
MSWSGWGDPAKARELPEPVLALLRDLLGVRAPGTPAAALEEVALPPVVLPEPVLNALAKVVGEQNVRTGHEDRVRHTRGKSTPDLLRMRAGDGSAAPDAVVLPGSHEEVAELLRVCSRERVAVVPFGGGTSVVGGLAPDRTGFAGVVALDLGRLDRLISVDEESMVAAFEPGVRAPDAERLLAARGLTLGHFPQSFEYATLGGFAAARSSGQASAGYGRFDDMVVGLTLATPAGTLELGRAPKSAAGPDLRQLVLGSEGAFGVITALRLRVRRAPAERRYEGWRFATFAQGSAAVRALAQEGPLPTVLRLSDETETMIGLAKPDEIGSDGARGPDGAGGSGAAAGSDGAGGSGAEGSGGAGSGGAGSGGAVGSGCLLVAGYEGVRVGSRHAAASALLARMGGEPLGPEPGEAWERGRFSAPYLRDSLLAAGATVETLETAGFWASLPRLYDAVRLALLGALGSPLVMCHISHVYETGASLYFTVVTPQDADPVAQWERAKAAVNAAVVEAGGTITHHHGVGRDHLDAYAREIGPVGTGVLRAVKAELDPAGILNPGVLVPRA